MSEKLPPSWPTSLMEMRERQKNMMTEAEYKEGRAIELRPTDVVIAPFAKSGTTWMQQIVHTLRTRGDMDFDDISRVVPWIETSPAVGVDLALQVQRGLALAARHRGPGGICAQRAVEDARLLQASALLVAKTQ